MKLDFIKTFGERVVVYLIVCAGITLGAVLAVAWVINSVERYLRNSGYRSVMLGPDGLRPEARFFFLVVIAILTFSVSFYLMIRRHIRYINRLAEKVREISEGDLDHPVEVYGNDEFASMAVSLNAMQKNVKQLMEKERMAEHTKNDLVSSVAHDLRTPLTSIIGYLGWIRTQKDLDDATREKYIEIAYSKALRLEQLTNELFGFVKLEHNEMTLRTAKLDLIQLMEQMLDEMTPSFVQNDLSVRFQHTDEVMVIEADGELLARLFANLLNNAVKYGKEGKQVRVEVEKSGVYAVTKVINYGRVIPKNELDAIFRKFYRTEQSRSRDTGGTGLGLAIAEQIAELHHGQIRVKSDLQGTVFEVELPMRQTEEEEAL